MINNANYKVQDLTTVLLFCHFTNSHSRRPSFADYTKTAWKIFTVSYN